MTSSTISSNTDDRRRNTSVIPLLILVTTLVIIPSSLLPLHSTASQKNQKPPKKKATLLRLLDLIPSPESIDYVQTKTPYQLHTLLTEQRHPKTWNLSNRIAEDMEAGLLMLFAVDEDIHARLNTIGQKNRALEQAVQAVEEAILSGHKIYLFGCQETGRWAKWLESSIWRPFWKNLQARKKIWAKVIPHTGEMIENRLIGEMPGADRSLISPLEGWEDLMITGRLQLGERGIEPGDVVFCVSASGESPAVIGTIYEALDQWTRRYPYDAPKIQQKLFYFFNNPEDVLLPFDRCQAVLEEPGITKMDLTTGPQAIAGSTRMQASTIDAFLIGQILQTGIDRALRSILSDKEMANLGFRSPVVFAEKLGEFSEILKDVKKSIPALAHLTNQAEKVYKNERHTTYSALRGFHTVFNDCAERGSAFQEYPLDAVETVPSKSRIQVWAPAASLEEAWSIMLGRPFRGLSLSSYKKRLEQETTNRDLIQTVSENLKMAEDDQQYLFDFSLSDYNLETRKPEKGDMGILVVISPEETLLKDKDSSVSRCIAQFLDSGARTAILFVTGKKEKDIKKMARKIPGFDPDGKDILAILPLDSSNDPMFINRLTALKIFLNAHSTAVMARSGRVIGNTVTAVDPNSLKSIGRGTFLILSHVNDILKRPDWVKRHGILEPISYGEANAVLYDAIGFMKGKRDGQDKSYEVALSIIRILESLRKNEAVSHEDAWGIVRDMGLQRYLKDVTS
jgi:N-acetylmuramic acid 6-phosphate (MurNAc-6-P) etherase